MRKLETLAVTCDRCQDEKLLIRVPDMLDIENGIKKIGESQGWRFTRDENGEDIELCPKCVEAMKTECHEPAVYEFFWPGQAAPGYICEKHAKQLMAIAQAFGLNGILHTITYPSPYRCMQQVIGEKKGEI